jgi:hypothetical protein
LFNDGPYHEICDPATPCQQSTATGWRGVEHVQHKLDVLRTHCAEIDREYGAIRKQRVGAEAGSAEARAGIDIVARQRMIANGKAKEGLQ